MGYMTLLAECGACRRPFACNPNYVPSLRHDGQQLVFCRDCIEAANETRKISGVTEITVHPNAYEPEQC